MPADAELMVLFGGLHLLGLVLVGFLLVLFLRSDTNRPRTDPEEGDGGGGGSDRLPRRRSGGPRGGGLPLPDAVPARVRLREPGRLADMLPGPPRRRTAEPRPGRTPVGV